MDIKTVTLGKGTSNKENKLK